MTPPPPVQDDENGSWPGHSGRENMEDIIRRIAERVARIDERTKIMQDDYVSKVRFQPIEKIVYGLVALILTVVIGSMIGYFQVHR